MTSFIAKPRELFDRFDPKYVAFKRRAANFRYSAVKMGSLLSEPPEYGAGEAGIERLTDTTPRYIRITDIDENGELLPGLGMTAANVEPQYFLRDGDLLFARSGNTVGKSYLHESERVPYPCFYAGYMIRFRFDEKVLPKYVFAFAQTPYYHEWVLAIQRSAGQPNINAQEYRSLEIPLPPLPEQRKIVAELDAAYAAKRAADEKATNLLASIADMVLNELGIARLPKPDTSLSSRIFTVPAKEVANTTLAPDHYFDSIDFSKAKYPCERFVERIDIDPPCGLEQITKLVSMESVSAEWCAIESIEDISPDATQGYSTFRGGDVIWARITPCMENGKSAVVEAEPSECFCGSTEFLVFRPKDDKVNPYYLQSLLHLKRFREVAAHHFTGTSGHQRVTADFFKSITIPIPPRSVQDRIASTASSIRAEARKLKADATAALDAAKIVIERRLVEE
ncbi:MAG: restriction endonuclease subunit S [Bacteroidales bacterium]|nr:restriction endonuclease subunit S [Bacteroidales bacterium]